MKLIKLMILFFLFCSALAFGENVTITVIDEDLEMPLEGAVIISWDGKELLCDSDGRAVLEVPGDRTVVVRISYPGYENSRVVLQPGKSEYTAPLRLGGTMEAQELVVEESRPGVSETVSGQSVAISGRELARHSETGIVEDVMNAVKLLPGVGYVGNYATMPSIRGGETDDIIASFDGFYVDRPFYWGGAFSIFDPKMVESAQLSHGVFSARYGHTVSGLLDIHAKNPSKDMETNLSISTSAANFSFSRPLGNSGGLTLMGRATYWDPFIELAKKGFEEIRTIRTAPYIRSAAFGVVYNFTENLSFSINGFLGMDGIAAMYEATGFEWNNKIGFFTTALNYSPKQNILFRTRIGVGFNQNKMNGIVFDEIGEMISGAQNMHLTESTANVQWRFDLDWDLGGGFVFSAGMEERYSRWKQERHNARVGKTDPAAVTNIFNQGFTSSLYVVLEYHSANHRLGIEAGIRGDHFLMMGEDFILKGIPVANPRLNLSFNVLENKGIIDMFTLTVGTGLFSSVNSVLQNIAGRNDFDPLAKPLNRSWNNIIGIKIDFSGGYSFILEGYVKNVFRRTYSKTSETGNVRSSDFFFDGKAFIWGFDLMLQKFNSRYWDGWISYSYINAKYLDPHSTDNDRNKGNWYYPGFHRFHTLNVVFNYKPIPSVQIMTRFSLASGVPVPRMDIYKEGSEYKARFSYDDNCRSGVNIPLDIKLSLFGFNRNGRAQRELYISIENILSLFYKAEGRPWFNSSNGERTSYLTMSTYELPIPMLTFGIKWSY